MRNNCKQIRKIIRKKYTKEGFLHELDKKDWNFCIMENNTPGKRSKNLENLVEQYTENICQSLDVVAPIKTVNIKTKQNSGRNSEEIRRQQENEKSAWTEWKRDPTNQHKKATSESNKRKNAND